MRVGPFLQDNVAGASFVGRVHVGKQVDDGDGIDAFVFQRSGTRAHSAFVQWLQFVAFVVEPAGSLEGQALRREVRRALEEIVEGVAVARLLLDLLDRAIAPGNHHADIGAAAF